MFLKCDLVRLIFLLLHGLSFKIVPSVFNRYWRFNMFKKLILGILTTVCFSFASAVVDLNTATAEQLQSALKGVGPAKAKAIVEYREKNGAFKSVDDLEKVKGFGAKTVNALRGELTVGGKAAQQQPKPAPKPALDNDKLKK